MVKHCEHGLLRLGTEALERLSCFSSLKEVRQALSDRLDGPLVLQLGQGLHHRLAPGTVFLEQLDQKRDALSRGPVRTHGSLMAQRLHATDTETKQRDQEQRSGKHLNGPAHRVPARDDVIEEVEGQKQIKQATGCAFLKSYDDPPHLAAD